MNQHRSLVMKTLFYEPSPDAAWLIGVIAAQFRWHVGHRLQGRPGVLQLQYPRDVGLISQLSVPTLRGNNQQTRPGQKCIQSQPTT